MFCEVNSSFHCTIEIQAAQLDMPERFFEASAVISVTPETSESTVWVDDSVTQAGYRFIARAARRFRRWITVTAEWCYRRMVHRVCRCFRNMSQNTGVQILRQSAILRI